MDVADLGHVVDVQTGDVGGDILGDVLQKAADFDLADAFFEQTALQDAGRGAGHLERELDGDGLAIDHFEEVNVQQSVGDGVELGLLDDGSANVTVDVDLCVAHLGGVEQVFELTLVHHEHFLILSAVNHARNHALITLGFRIFFPYVLSQRTANRH